MGRRYMDARVPDQEPFGKGRHGNGLRRVAREGRAIRWRLLSDGLQRHMDLGRVELAAGITAGLAMAYDEVRGNAVIFGGGTAIPPTVFNDTWVWDGTTWTQLFPATSPSARSSSALTYHAARGTAVL